MPSFDIVSNIDHQKLDNAINTARKEIVNRYDFHDSKTTVEFDKKTLAITIVTENDMRMNAIEDILIGRAVKQGIDTASFNFGKEVYASGSMIRKDIIVKEGVEQEIAKQIVKVIKNCGIKVQGSIMDKQVRVTGKKIDDLQKVISVIKASEISIPLQYENFRN